MDRRNLPSFSSLRAFEAAARHLSFRAAGEEHESCIVVPAMKVRNFRFTGTTPD